MRRTETDQALGVVLRGLREQKGITQEALAFKAGVTIATLSRIERGVSSSAWRTIQAIAGALDASMAEVAAAVGSGSQRSDAQAGAAGLDGAGGRHDRSTASRPRGLEPSVARVVLACVPVTLEGAADAATIAREAEVVLSTARKYLDALVAVGDVVRVPGEPIRFYVSEQGDRWTRQEVQDAHTGAPVQTEAQR
jgi:transcriptional regulator with XRE-family HTH domain